MPFLAFEGPAGTGKTYRLMEEVRGHAAQLLRADQQVLGLTFMHGARRRLDESFVAAPETRGKSHVTTIDSFAAHLVRRWSPLAPAIADFTQFDEVCDACGMLLERPEILNWVTETFPIVAIDEAQELSPSRLRIARAFADAAHLVVAADEFQCLDEQIDTAPFLEWFATGNVERLEIVRRTNRRGLLDAGVALRAGKRPIPGSGLSIRYQFPAQVKFAVGHALRNGTGSRAVLVAPGSARWANELIPLLAAGLRSKNQQVPPLPIAWESAPSNEAQTLAEALFGADELIHCDDLIGRTETLDVKPVWLDTLIQSVEMARRAHGIRHWDMQSLSSLCAKKANLQRAYCRSSMSGIPVMSIQAAKNRQFRDVVVLWGPGVHGDADHQRRLLYNAISRAEYTCTVIVRTQQLLASPPFS
ncbi:MAG: AAA family ATPase [Parvibaculaceae bacterium]